MTRQVEKRRQQMERRIEVSEKVWVTPSEPETHRRKLLIWMSVFAFLGIVAFPTLLRFGFGLGISYVLAMGLEAMAAALALYISRSRSRSTPTRMGPPVESGIGGYRRFDDVAPAAVHQNYPHEVH